MKENITKIFVGVDVAKRHLDIHFNPTNKNFRVTNDLEGLAKLKNELKKFEVDKIVCESSGNYEYLMMKELQHLGYRVWRVEGSRIKAFIRSEGIMSKNDKQDAKMIALFATQKNPKNEVHFPSESENQLRELVRRKNDLIGMASAEKTRLQQIYDKYCQESIASLLQFFEGELKKINSKIKEIIESSPELTTKFKIVTSMPGIGEATASALLAELPELGTATKTEIAALTGLAPYTRESGSYKGKAFISQGRALVRKSIYMAALTASFHNPILKEFYKKLRAAGKAAKVAIIAVARRMVVIINTMLKNKQSWQASGQPIIAGAVE